MTCRKRIRFLLSEVKGKESFIDDVGSKGIKKKTMRCMAFSICGGVDGTRTRGLRRDRPAL
jgi:hypothetical protein